MRCAAEVCDWGADQRLARDGREWRAGVDGMTIYLHVTIKQICARNGMTYNQRIRSIRSQDNSIMVQGTLYRCILNIIVIFNTECVGILYFKFMRVRIYIINQDYIMYNIYIIIPALSLSRSAP